MAEPSTTLAGAAGGAAVMGLGAMLLRWLAGREIARLDTTLEKHARALDELEIRTVTKADLDALRGDLLRYHHERTEEVRRVHERIDRLVEQRKP